MSETVVLKCGCTANTLRHNRDGTTTPTCIHGTTEQIEKPSLEGRFAKCAYGGSVVKSNWNLAFFEYMGPGSKEAEEKCECGYYEVAHTPEIQAHNPLAGCKKFKPAGPAKYDRYYCGCYGWD